MNAILIPRATVAVDLEDLTLDLICFNHAFAALGDRRLAGGLTGYVEAALDANPGLARNAAIERGRMVVLPEFVIETAAPAVRLWD